MHGRRSPARGRRSRRSNGFEAFDRIPALRLLRLLCAAQGGSVKTAAARAGYVIEIETTLDQFEATPVFVFRMRARNR
jgi:hypothetical protein